MADQTDSEDPPLAFLNVDFLKTPAALTIRILSEYLEPAERLRRARIYDTIVFFGSARCFSPEDAAQQLARINEQVDRDGSLSPELRQARARAEAGMRLARYY